MFRKLLNLRINEFELVKAGNTIAVGQNCGRNAIALNREAGPYGFVAGVEVNRKMLSEMAISDPAGFAALAELAKSKVA